MIWLLQFCEQPACNTLDAIIKVAYAAAATAAILVIMAYVRRKRSAPSLR